MPQVDLHKANECLRQEIAERKKAEADVRRLNEELERRVLERTQELSLANQRLQEVQSHLRQVFDSVLSAVVVIDSAGKIIDWNSRAEIMFGWPREEALGLNLAETLIPPQYREAHLLGLRLYLAGGPSPAFEQTLELSALRRDGNEFPVELSVRPLTLGECPTFCGFLTDISERRQAAEDLRKSQELLRTVIENSQAVIYAKDLSGKYILVNRRYCELFHVTPEEMVGKTDFDLFSPEVARAFREMDERVAAAGHPLTEEEEAPEDDGIHAYISVKCPLRDAAGEIYGIFGVSTDITERKRVEERLQAHLGRLDLLNSITRAIGERQDLASIFQVVVCSLEERLPLDFCCIYGYDAGNRLLKVGSLGAQAERVSSQQTALDVDQDTLSRCLLGQLVYEPDIARLDSPFPKLLAQAGLHSLLLAPLKVENRIFGILAAARTQKAGFAGGDYEFLRQLSEHVSLAANQAHLHEDLQRAYDDLRETREAVLQHERLRALGQMASGIAHDINNAISPISLYTGSLLENEPNLSPQAREYLKITERAIDDVAATVARMREFYRQPGREVEFKPVNLRELVLQVKELTRARWSDMQQRRGIVIQVETRECSDSAIILGVESEIREALTNLVLNSVDSMPDGGVLSISARLANSRVELEVSDQGAGMTEETRARCLEPFFTTKGERGTGLGLAMVYGVVERHSGSLNIDSEPGRGTAVRISFPATSSAAPPDSSPDRWVDPLRILIVDDDPIVLKSVQRILENDGHKVVAASGGKAGVDAFAAAAASPEPFSVVITDLGMPHVDGRQVAISVKEVAPQTPIIMLTGWGQRLVAEGEVPSQVAVVLSKPPKLRELREALHLCCSAPDSNTGGDSR